jgi:pimeloyl-ACP methyl ester carboxylesterase
MADIGQSVRLHHVDAGNGPQTAVLLHGFPQTSHEWMKIVPTLVGAGLRVVAPDYRGAGWSSKPASGYDKRTMAEDTRTLLREHLGIAGPVILVGHDIGALVAIAFALAHREDVSHLAVVDAPVPGTTAFDRVRGDPRGWHAHTRRGRRDERARAGDDRDDARDCGAS